MSYWKGKRVIVTGGAGLIGVPLVENLVHEGCEVTVIDNFFRSKPENLSRVREMIELLDVDLRDNLKARAVIRDADIVIHLASKVGGIGVYTNCPYSIMSDNVLIDTNVLQAAMANGVPRFFYASSAHVYPYELQNEMDAPLINEGDAVPANPLLSYGWAKLQTETQIRCAIYENPNFRAAIARYIGVYGPNQDFDLATGSVIPVFAHRAIKYPDVAFAIWGDGEETRSYCYINDAIECTKLMIEKLDDLRFVGPFNVGSEEQVKIKEIAEKLITISGKDIPIQYDETKAAKILAQNCSCESVHKSLGWRATTSLDDGLKIIYEDITARLAK
jgi:nucleoside-diphosphate-sugar epimerase